VRRRQSNPASVGCRISGEQKIGVPRFQKWWLFGKTKGGAPRSTYTRSGSGGGELDHFPASDGDEMMRSCRSEHGELDVGSGEPRRCRCCVSGDCGLLFRRLWAAFLSLSHRSAISPCCVSLSFTLSPSISVSLSLRINSRADAPPGNICSREHRRIFV
jgi:hypothetical protein